MVRVAHLSPETGGADVWVAAAGRAKTEFAHNVTYGGFTPYANVPPGTYGVSMYPSGNKSGRPLLQGNITLVPGGVYTVAVTGAPSHLRDRVINDELNRPPAGEATVRVIQASTKVGAPNIRVTNGPLLATDLSYGAVTGYATVPGGRWDLSLSTRPGYRLQIDLNPGAVYSIVLLNRSNTATVRVTTDAATPVAPTTAPAGATASGPTSYTAQEGDSFWTISQRFLENALGRPPTDGEIEAYVSRLIAANVDRLLEPGHPNLIFVGQSFVLPPT
jgi:hypothetical protein